MASAVPSAAPPTVAPNAPSSAGAHGNIVGAVTTKPSSLQAAAVVYLEDGPRDEGSAPSKPVTILNKAMNFLPYVAIAVAGTKVVFSNGDPFPHNVFSSDNEKFNVGTIGASSAQARVFKTPGTYSLLCNLHPGMLGYLVVTPSAWYAKTDPKGKFSIKNVPSGTYKVTAWAPRMASVTQSVTVADGDVSAQFDLHR
jgi:plastocyanin